MANKLAPSLARQLMVMSIAAAFPMVGMAAEDANSKHKSDQSSTGEAPQAPTTELREVEVNTTREVEEKGYLSTKTRVGKVLQDPQDVPQAVTTITRDLMHDQQVSSLKDALRNVSGLTFNAGEGGRAGDNMMLRGFYTFGDIYLDGIRDTAQYNRETFNLEKVDVLRGSAAMLFGRGQAGGVINQVTKMAELEDQNTISASAGNYGYDQLTGDFNKKLSETAAIRVNVMHRDEETYRQNPANGDRPEIHRDGVAVSLGLGIGTDNEFFLNHLYTVTRDVPDYGIRFTNTRPTSPSGTYWGGSKNFDDSDVNVTTGILTHKFSEDTQLRTQLRHADYERAYWVKTPGTTAPTATLGVGGNVTRKMEYKTDTLQSDLSTKFDVWGMKHEALAGIEYMHENSYRQSLLNLGTATNPYYSPDAVTGAASTFKADNYAVYAQDTIEFIPKWKLLLGTRRDEMKADYSSATSPKLSYGEWSTRTGLSYQPTETQHYYVSYSDSFSPTADLYQLTVSPLPPERSKTVEVGSKWLFMDGDLAFRTALYRSTKDWERNTDLESTAAILTKKRRTDGLEFELAGRITDNWEVFSGVAFMDAKILEVAQNVNATTGVLTSADARFVGQRARNTPPVTFNVWSTYKFAGHWKVGGGVEAKAERYGYSPSAATGQFTNGVFTPNTLPGYARLDAMLAYEEQKWAVRLNVKNLLDKEYYDALYDNGGFSVPGNRRTAIVTTEYKF